MHESAILQILTLFLFLQINDSSTKRFCSPYAAAAIDCKNVIMNKYVKMHFCVNAEILGH